MNADVARIYNERAAPIFRQARTACRPARPRLPGRSLAVQWICSESAGHGSLLSPKSAPTERVPTHRSWASKWWTPIRAASATQSSLRTAYTSQARRRRHCTRRMPTFYIYIQAHCMYTAYALHTRRVSPLQARSRGSTRRSFSAPCAIHQRTTSSLKHTGNLRYCSKRARGIARGVSLLFLYFDSIKCYRPGQGDRGRVRATPPLQVREFGHFGLRPSSLLVNKVPRAPRPSLPTRWQRAVRACLCRENVRVPSRRTSRTSAGCPRTP